MSTRNKIILTRGLVASGKSTWAKQFISDDTSYQRVCRDDLRHMLNNYKHTDRNEEIVTEVRDAIIKILLANNKSVVVDETALNHNVEKQMLKIAQAARADLEVKEFHKSLEDCIKDDATRPNPVGSKIIMRMHEKYLAKHEPEQKIDSNKPWAVIVDMDGTVCKLNGRNPFNTSMCAKDLPHEHVLAVIAALQATGDHVIFLTGRDEQYREPSEKWLTKHVKYSYQLYMREIGDKRKDFLYKSEVLETKIMPNYNIRLCLEDRPRNLRAFRALGLPTLDCGRGFEF